MDEKGSVIYKLWKSPSPLACLLLVHGLGGHSERWNFLSHFFLQHNISSYAMELRGFGETKDLKGDIDSFNIYLDDIRYLYNIIAEENIGKKVFLAGESLGALIAFLFSISEQDLFSGLICISPSFRSRLKFTGWDYVKIYASLLFNPRKQFLVPFTSDMCTRDIDIQKAMDDDSKEHRLATSRFLVCVASAQIRAKISKNRLKVPVLFLLAGNDKLVDPESARSVFNNLKVNDKELIDYPNMYHALSIEIGREKVFEDILGWLSKRV